MTPVPPVLKQKISKAPSMQHGKTMPPNLLAMANAARVGSGEYQMRYVDRIDHGRLRKLEKKQTRFMNHFNDKYLQHSAEFQ